MNNSDEDSAVLHAILEAAVDAIIVADQKGRIRRRPKCSNMKLPKWSGKV